MIRWCNNNCPVYRTYRAHFDTQWDEEKFACPLLTTCPIREIDYGNEIIDHGTVEQMVSRKSKEDDEA